MKTEQTAVQVLLEALGLDNLMDVEETQKAFVHRVVTMGGEDWTNLIEICDTALINEQRGIRVAYASGAAWAWAHPVDNPADDSNQY